MLTTDRSSSQPPWWRPERERSAKPRRISRGHLPGRFCDQFLTALDRGWESRACPYTSRCRTVRTPHRRYSRRLKVKQPRSGSQCNGMLPKCCQAEMRAQGSSGAKNDSPTHERGDEMERILKHRWAQNGGPKTVGPFTLWGRTNWSLMLWIYAVAALAVPAGQTPAKWREY